MSENTNKILSSLALIQNVRRHRRLFEVVFSNIQVFFGSIPVLRHMQRITKRKFLF